VTIFAGSVDSEEQTLDVSRQLNFPVAWGMTRAMGDAIGAWWDEKRNHIKPSEFLLTNSGHVAASTYSNSPVGRMDPAEVVTLMKFLTRSKSR